MNVPLIHGISNLLLKFFYTIRILGVKTKWLIHLQSWISHFRLNGVVPVKPVKTGSRPSPIPFLSTSFQAILLRSTLQNNHRSD